MNKETKLFIKDLKAVLKKHSVYINITKQYGHNERYLGQNFEILSNQLVNGKLPIYLDTNAIEYI